MSGAQQISFMNQRSFGTPPPDAIGSAYQGGFYAGQISTTADSVATHYLVVGPRSTAQSTLQWKIVNTPTAGTASTIDGPANTAAMIAAGAADHPCGQFCNDLVVGGFSDWYMPAKNELEVCYYNLKPSTDLNNTSYGANPNAVPARASNYTAATPARTSAADFIAGSAQAFNSVGLANVYWASTQGLNDSEQHKLYGAIQRFSVGSQNAYYKNNSFTVRAVRRVPV